MSAIPNVPRDDAGTMILTNRCDAGVPADTTVALLERGIGGHLDYNLGASMNPEDIDRDQQR